MKLTWMHYVFCDCNCLNISLIGVGLVLVDGVWVGGGGVNGSGYKI